MFYALGTEPPTLERAELPYVEFVIDDTEVLQLDGVRDLRTLFLIELQRCGWRIPASEGFDLSVPEFLSWLGIEELVVTPDHRQMGTVYRVYAERLLNAGTP